MVRRRLIPSLIATIRRDGWMTTLNDVSHRDDDQDLVRTAGLPTTCVELTGRDPDCIVEDTVTP